MKVETYSGIMGIAIVMAADGGCGSDDGGGGGLSHSAFWTSTEIAGSYKSVFLAL